MSIFQWKQAYETGIDTIDNQHRHLVELINQLDDLLKHTQAKELKDINTELEDIYTQLFDYTIYHFNYEEQLMEQSSTYPDTAHKAHKKQHDQFIHELKSVLNDFQEVNSDDAKVILSYLTNWLTNHISKIDKKMATHVEQSIGSLTNGEANSKEGEAWRIDAAEGNRFLNIFMGMSQHLNHHLGQIEKQLSDLQDQITGTNDPTTQNIAATKKSRMQNIAERVAKRVQVVKTLVKNLDSSARNLVRRKKDD